MSAGGRAGPGGERGGSDESDVSDVSDVCARRDLSATGTYRWAVQREARTPARHGRVGSALAVAVSSDLGPPVGVRVQRKWVWYDRLWRRGAHRSGGMGMCSAVAVGWDELPSGRRARAVAFPPPLPCLASCTPAGAHINGHCTAQCG
jgi:hypothetical protein